MREAADAEPLVFVQTVVPYLRQVMAATAMEPRDDEPIRDHHFSARYEVEELDDRELDDALFAASVRAWRGWRTIDPRRDPGLLEELAADPYDGSQFLLYRALTGGR